MNHQVNGQLILSKHYMNWIWTFAVCLCLMMALRTFCGHLFTIALTWSNDLLIQFQNNRHINNGRTSMWVASLVCVEPVKQVKLYPCRWGGACAAEDVVDLRHQGTLTIRKWNTQRYLEIALLWCIHCQTWN